MTPLQQSQQRQREAARASYLLYGAENDPMTVAVARMLSNKMGGGFGLTRDLLLGGQAFFGMENGGAAMAANISAQIQRSGALTAYQGASSYGTISGGGAATYQASRQLLDEINRRFTNPTTGVPNNRAAGLSAAEMGQLASHIMGSGSQYGMGPMFRMERVNEERISQLKQWGADTYKKTGNRGELNEAELLKPGDFRASLTGNVDKFSKYMEDGAKVFSDLKEIFGGRAINDLDAAFRDVLGGNLQEFGAKAARMKMARMKMTAMTSFGGNMMEAAAFEVGNANMISGITAQQFAAAGVNVDPASLGLLGSMQAGYASNAGLIGGRAQQANAGYLESKGIGYRARGTGEIAQETAMDMARIGFQEKEALALSSFKQEYGNTLGDKDKSLIESALSGLGGAGTEKEVNAARQNAAAIFQRLSGTSVGAYVGNAENQARLMTGLAGDSAQEFSDTIGQSQASRMQDLLRRNFSDDTTLQKRLGLTSSEAGLAGAAVSNLGAGQLAGLEKALASGGDISAYLKDPGVASALQKAGVDPSKFEALAKSGKLNGDSVAVLRGKSTRYAGMENFTGEGDKQQAAIETLKEFSEQNQMGTDSVGGNFVEEFIKGLAGDKPVRGAALLEAARGDKDLAGSIQTAKIDPVTGQLLGGKENATRVAAMTGNSIFSKLGLKDGDMEGLSKALADPASSQKIFESLAAEGSLSIRDGELSYLDKDATEQARRKGDVAARTTLYNKLGGTAALPERKSGESEEDFRKRYDEALSKGTADQLKGDKASQLVRDYAWGKDGAEDTVKALKGSGMLKDAGLRSFVSKIDETLKSLDVSQSNLEPGSKASEAVRERSFKLQELRDNLVKGQDGARQTASVVQINAGSVNINSGSR